MVLPGTELWRKAEGLHLEFDPEPPYVVRSHLSMSATDIEYGAKVVDAIGTLGRSKTVRLLCKEPGVTFAGIVDDWIAWEPEQSAAESRWDKVQRFLSRLCEKRQIPIDFYRGFASFEFQ
jgi:hypothetical protein